MMNLRWCVEDFNDRWRDVLMSTSIQAKICDESLLVTVTVYIHSSKDL